jgi:hypothetical protein
MVGLDILGWFEKLINAFFNADFGIMTGGQFIVICLILFLIGIIIQRLWGDG